MSEVLIKGMEMPKNCRECNFCNKINFEGYLWFDFYCRAKDKSFDLDKNKNKPDWCPLISVPTPHGRLIDAHELYGAIVDKGQKNERGKYRLGEYWELTGHEIREVINGQPTIIDAEGSDNG